jgi:hypothetical protein
VGTIVLVDIIVEDMAAWVVWDWLVEFMETVGMSNWVVDLVVVVSTCVPSCKVPTGWLTSLVESEVLT